MFKSKILGMVRTFHSFMAFNRALLRWPKFFVEQSAANISTYGENVKFKARVEEYPTWMPLKMRVLVHSAKMAWHLANLDFSFGLEGMYRHSIMMKVTNDLFISFINHGLITESLRDELIKREECVSSGKLTGSGRVWDFYDDAYNAFVFTEPYRSTLDTLLRCDFIVMGVYEKYLPEVTRLDNILKKHDAVMYAESNSNAFFKNYDDSYFESRLYKDDSISLTRLTEFKRVQ